MKTKSEVGYLIHFDQFINSRRYFLTVSSEENLNKKREYGFITAVRKFVRRTSSQGILFQIRGETKENDIRLCELCNDFLFLETDRGKVFEVYDDFLRSGDPQENDNLSSAFETFKKAICECAIPTFSFCSFAGYHSGDCVPAFVQFLVEGKGVSLNYFDGQQVLEFSNPTIPLDRVIICGDALYPPTERLTFNSLPGLTLLPSIPARSICDLTE